MATSLPLRLRSNIRDLITSPTSAVAIHTTALAKTIGFPISLDPEWSMLWTTLQPHYPDPATFIPNIARVLVAWCDAFTSWLEAEENEDGVERLLGEMNSTVKIVIEIAAKGTRPFTTWRADRCVFVIGIPKAAPLTASTIHAGLSSDFLSLLTPPFSSPSSLHPSVATIVPDDPEGWADVSFEPEARTLAPSRQSTQENANDLFPELSLIPRPEELLKRPPYWLLVRQESRERIVVQGSHAPSLECLEAYLKQWCRGNSNLINRPPVVEVKLEQSAFGIGLLNDTLILQAENRNGLSAMLVLVFIESVLKYEPVMATRTAGSVWEFKRVKGFK